MDPAPDRDTCRPPPRRATVSLWVPLFLAGFWWVNLFVSLWGDPGTQPAGEAVEVKFQVRRGHNEEIVAAVARAPRALVFLTGCCSQNAKLGEQGFDEGAGRLWSRHGQHDLRFFVLEVSETAVRAWLTGLDADVAEVFAARNGYSIGNGTVLWLEAGGVVARVEDWPQTPDQIVSRTLQLWPRPKRP